MFKKMLNELERFYGRLSIFWHGFYFVDVPRTSSTSIRSELGRRFGRAYGKQNVSDKRFSTQQIFSDHVPAREMRDLLGPFIWDRIFTFSVVRNPWDRTFSMYNYRSSNGNIPQDWSFRDYVMALDKADENTPYYEYRGYRYGASDYLLDEDGKLIVDYIVRYEDREFGLNQVSSRIKIENLGVNHLQSSAKKSKHYSELYDNETIEIIRNLYAIDIKLFGYDYEDKKVS